MVNKKLLAKKIGKNISEWETGKPMSNGRIIKSKKEAIKIAYSESGEHKPLVLKKVKKSGLVKKV